MFIWLSMFTTRQVMKFDHFMTGPHILPPISTFSFSNYKITHKQPNNSMVVVVKTKSFKPLSVFTLYESTFVSVLKTKQTELNAGASTALFIYAKCFRVQKNIVGTVSTESNWRNLYYMKTSHYVFYKITPEKNISAFVNVTKQNCHVKMHFIRNYSTRTVTRRSQQSLSFCRIDKNTCAAIHTGTDY